MIQELNDWLEPRLIELGRLVRSLTGWVPIQFRRAIRIAAMAGVAELVSHLLGFEFSDLEEFESLGFGAAIAAQELTHRWLAPATPDRERRIEFAG